MFGGLVVAGLMLRRCIGFSGLNLWLLVVGL